ncbi:MAG: hypothetical protein V9H25_16510 [Candidatus Competibacter sp.]
MLSFAKHPYITKVERSETLLSDEQGLTRIFAILREKCKVDFTFYKPSTVTRRIERRMTINQTDDIKDYVASALGTAPAKSVALYRELLIGVTSFFRDQDAYDRLAQYWFAGDPQQRQHPGNPLLGGGLLHGGGGVQLGHPGPRDDGTTGRLAAT